MLAKHLCQRKNGITHVELIGLLSNFAHCTNVLYVGISDQNIMLAIIAPVVISSLMTKELVALGRLSLVSGFYRPWFCVVYDAKTALAVVAPRDIL